MLEGVRGVIFPYASSVELVGPLAGGNVPAGGKLWTLAASSPGQLEADRASSLVAPR